MKIFLTTSLMLILSYEFVGHNIYSYKKFMEDISWRDGRKVNNYTPFEM